MTPTARPQLSEDGPRKTEGGEVPKNWKVPNGPAVRHFPRNCRFSDAEKIGNCRK